MPQRRLTNENAIFSLWLNWTMSIGALTLPAFLSLFIAKLWIPLVTFGVMGLLILFNNTDRKYKAASCDLIPMICIRSLGFSAIIMMVICIAYTRGIINRFYDEALLNQRIPYITILVIAPVVLVVCCWAVIMGKKTSICRSCTIKYGTASERGFLGKLFHQESSYQIWFLLIMAIVISIVSWIYYGVFYVNVNMNTPDHFFFNWLPTILFGISVIYLGMRYFTLWGYYYQNVEGSAQRHGASSCLRFIIICDEQVLLHRAEEFYDIPDQNKFDTPATLFRSYSERITPKEATVAFCDLSNLQETDFTLRFMYTSNDANGECNAFHYICCLENKDLIKQSQLRGKWYSLSQLQRLLYNHDLSPLMATEIHRLYTITMAWKTYDSEGRRLYKVKNYRPAFRLNGICDWDVDFNSPQWLQVARFNEDKPFFKIRRFWKKRISGEK